MIIRIIYLIGQKNATYSGVPKCSFDPECKIIKYLKSQIPDGEKLEVEDLILNFKGEVMSGPHGLLYFNKFVKLNDDDILILGKYLIKTFVYYLDENDGRMPYKLANIYGFLFGGILLKYAKIQGEDKDIIEEIKTFAKCFRLNYDNIFIYRLSNKGMYYYRDGSQYIISDKHIVPPLTVVEDDPEFD